MKKFLLSFTAIIIFLLCACSNEKIETTISSGYQKPDTCITTILESYNASLSTSLINTRGKNTQHKKGISKGRLWTIVAADVAAGIPAFIDCVDLAAKIVAATGGTAGPATAAAILAATGFIAGGASYGAYLTTSGCSISKVSQNYLDLTKNNNAISLKLNTILLENQRIAFTDNTVNIKNDSIYLLVGQLHNDILKELISPKPSTFSTPIPPIKNDVNFIPASKPQILFKNSYGLTVYSNTNIENLSQKIIEEDITIFNCNTNYIEALTTYKSKGILTNKECDILSLFFEAFNESAEKPSDMDNIVNYYTNKIRTANELGYKEKQQLQLCLAIAKYSFHFWYEKGIME